MTTRPAAPAAPASGFDDPDFRALCDVVHTLRSLRARRTAEPERLRALMRLPHLVRAVRRLPAIELPLTASPEGDEIRAFLSRRVWGLRYTVATSTLTLPDRAADYLAGRARQALRTNAAKARKAGVTAVREERADRIRTGMATIVSHRQEADGGAWLRERAERRIGDFWFAVGADGAPLAVAEAVVDRDVAQLACLVGSELPHAGEARYLLLTEVVTALIERGVRYVVVGRSVSLEPGLIYFQQRTGFVPANLRLAVAPDPRSWPTSVEAGLPAPRRDAEVSSRDAVAVPGSVAR